ncbi:endonuclease/exonuclease/phosphatase family protein [Alkaliphilus serpentinus]|uniref:Endonuclease/exonuclease/phosphatase domain-containing protein n=1 Tax=Alkaliphilus serpentinus TaxID=1482731 RepID=A0A833HPI1_9FIRM|nr:endonuclease/exonuclease/phosphatase family protein [Alkaliphilus serpentinus]KAB3530755.1 hypothetical protein F8153_06505 [Alkaliphilus serpentinus]
MKKMAIVAAMIIFVMVSSFLMNVTSQEDINVLKYMNGDQIHYIEIVTAGALEEVVAEAINNENQSVHYAVLNQPIKKTDHAGNKRNHFYITRSKGQLENFSKLSVYPPNGSSKLYNMQEIQTIDINSAAIGGNELKMMRDLSVMSYNIHHGKSLLGGDSLDTIADLIEASGADIIGLQEIDKGVYRSKFRNQLKYLADRLSMYYVYGENVNFLSGKYGNGILSRYPITYSENLLLPSRREQRGLLRADIDIDGKKVHFLSTHLGLNSAERAKQMGVIQDYTKTLTEEVILVGDFNSSSRDEDIRSISKKMLDTGYAAGQDQQPTLDFPFISGRIDYIFISPTIELKDYRVIKSRASDHYPIEVKLTLP